MAKSFRDIKSLARTHTESAVRVLAGIMGQTDAPPSARVQAASVLLDRGWGKAHQTSESTHTIVRADQATDDILLNIALGRSDGSSEAESDTPIIN